MNWDIVSALAELSGSVAVFITLYFLLAQLRHANMLARSAFDSESTSRITDRFIRVAENENFAHLLTIDWDAKTLGDVDRTRISYYVAALLHNSHNSFQQWKIGILTEEQAVRPIHAINTGIMENHTAKTIWVDNRLKSIVEVRREVEPINCPDGLSCVVVHDPGVYCVNWSNSLFLSKDADLLAERRLR